MNAIDVRELASEERLADVVVVGSGVAGLSAALGLAARGRRVTILTKTELGGGSSRWAQGGVAAALARGDSPRAHSDDTLVAADGLGEGDVIDILTHEGPARVRELIELGGRFDRDADGRLALGREGAHSHRRILHADGDATGREMVRALRAAVLEAGDRGVPGSITVVERAFARDLVLSGDRVVGVLARHAGGRRVWHHASAVILATGGLGQLFERTTNPPEATGDGLAMAARAGAVLADLELVQFHPTALAVPGDPAPLVTEALRGEGAILVDETGTRFMPDVDPRAELAPRDVVARAIHARQLVGHRIFLDARDAVGAAFPERFPTVWRHCQDHGIDPRVEPIPVTPAAHYSMAGVAVDTEGRTSLPGLWACGEVTSTGVHGANRLASNSLLEALVFGARVAEDISGSARPQAVPRPVRPEVVWRESPAPGRPAADFESSRRRIRELMWQRVALVREGDGLERALDELAALEASLPDPATPRDLETWNLVCLGRWVTVAALAREETRGSHYRSDFPERDPSFRRRLFWTVGSRAEDAALVAAPRFPAALPAREIA